MELITNTRDNAESPFSHNYEYSDLFPSVNTTYKINDKHQLRLSYGKTVNRPEFREVSPQCSTTSTWHQTCRVTPT